MDGGRFGALASAPQGPPHSRWMLTDGWCPRPGCLRIQARWLFCGDSKSAADPVSSPFKPAPWIRTPAMDAEHDACLEPLFQPGLAVALA